MAKCAGIGRRRTPHGLICSRPSRHSSSAAGVEPLRALSTQRGRHLFHPPSSILHPPSSILAGCGSSILAAASAFCFPVSVSPPPIPFFCPLSFCLKSGFDPFVFFCGKTVLVSLISAF